MSKLGWLFMLLLLVGCSKEAKNEIPVLDRSASLGGVDADNNGIRDDIDKLIIMQHKGPEETKAMQQTARAIQYELVAGIKNRESVKESSDQLSKALGCLSQYEDGLKLGDLINKSTKNTRARILEEDRVDQLANGTVIHSYGSEACE